MNVRFAGMPNIPAKPCISGMKKNRFFLVLFVVIVYVVAMTYVMRSYFVDDAYIGFRYISNLHAGNGFVFNPLERVEGISNIGWLLTLIPFSFLVDVTVAAKVIGALLVIATAILSYAIACRLSEDGFDYTFVLPIPILVATQFDYIFFSICGMETALLSAVLCSVLYLTLADRYWVLNAFLCSFAFLLHPECVLIFPIAFVARWKYDFDSWNKHRITAGIFAAAIIGYTVLRYAYYHDFLPNTFYAKPPNPSVMLRSIYGLLSPLSGNISLPLGGMLIFLLLVYAAFSLWSRFRAAAIYMVTIVLVGIAFCIYVRPDWTTMGRYFAPYIPITFILFWKGLTEIHKKLFPGLLGTKRLSQLIIMYSVITVLLGFGGAYIHLRPKYIETYPGFVLTSKNLIEPSLWMRDNLPDGAIIATRRIGALSYYSQKIVFDYAFGLTNKEIARLVQAKGSYFNNPQDPLLKEIWKRISPDYVLEDLSAIRMISDGSKDRLQRFEIQGIPYRIIKTFPIGASTSWILCAKTYPDSSRM